MSEFFPDPKEFLFLVKGLRHWKLKQIAKDNDDPVATTFTFETEIGPIAGIRSKSEFQFKARTMEELQEEVLAKIDDCAIGKARASFKAGELSREVLSIVEDTVLALISLQKQITQYLDGTLRVA